MNLHVQVLEVQNGSMQWARIHTMIGLNEKLILGYTQEFLHFKSSKRIEFINGKSCMCSEC